MYPGHNNQLLIESVRSPGDSTVLGGGLCCPIADFQAEIQ